MKISLSQPDYVAVYDKWVVVTMIMLDILKAMSILTVYSHLIQQSISAKHKRRWVVLSWLFKLHIMNIKTQVLSKVYNYQWLIF